MGLVKCIHVWWMSFMYQGRQVRRSTGTTDKRLAEAILCKVKVQITEGRFFETREEQDWTFREMMVLRLLGKGRSVSAIAEDLALSVKTISTYRARILEKLSCQTTAELIRYAIDAKLVE